MTMESNHFKRNTGYHQQKSQKLMNMMEKISAHNQYQRYTNPFFQWTKKKYDQVKQEKLQHVRKLEETLKNLQSYQTIVKLLEKDCDKKNNSTKS